MTLMERVAALELAVFGEAKEPPPGYTPPPIHTPTPPPKVYEFSEAGLLAGGRTVGNVYIDPIVGPDCPRTVVLPQTGHVLSVPRPDIGEMVVGYLMRVSDQAGGDYKLAGSVMGLGPSSVFWKGFKADDPNTWPEAVDRFFNARSYMTPEQLAEDLKREREWGFSPRAPQ